MLPFFFGLHFFHVTPFCVALFSWCTLLTLHVYRILFFLVLLHVALCSCCCFLLLHSIQVTLFLFCTFFILYSFHVPPFSVFYFFNVTPSFVLHSFCVALFSSYTFFMLHFFSVAQYSSCTLFMLHLFLHCILFIFNLFCDAMQQFICILCFSCFLCCLFFVLGYLTVAVLSSCTIFMFYFFSYCSLKFYPKLFYGVLMSHLFLCCTAFMLYLFLYCTLFMSGYFRFFVLGSFLFVLHLFSFAYLLLQHSFHAAIFMLHFFQFGPSLLTCFSFNSFHGALFFATFRHTVHFSHCTLSCRIHLMLHLFPVVHFSCYSLFTLDFCYIKTALNHATFPVSCQSS